MSKTTPHRTARASTLKAALTTESQRLLILLVVTATLGYVSHAPLLVMLLATLSFIGWHAWWLWRLGRAVETGQGFPLSPHTGIWPYLYDRFETLRLSNRRRKRRTYRLEARFRDAATALPDAAVMMGRRWNILWANPAAANLIGIDYPRHQGASLTELVRDPLLEEYLRKGDFNHSIELQSPTDASIMLSLLVRPFGKKKRQRLLMARDITRIYHLDQARRDFIASVSHELRTPLTVIAGFLELLVDQDTGQEQRQHALRQMQQQAARMDALISDLLALSRLEMERQAPNDSVVAVTPMLEAILDEARALSASADHQLHLEPDHRLALRGEPSELYSAFSNLVFNAIRHTPPGANVRISCQRTSQGAEISVSDSGEGIAARHIPRLTERFYRVDPGRARKAGGTGLGLAIVKHALSRHDADLQIRSEIGHGSTFTCRFPQRRVTTLERNQAEARRHDCPLKPATGTPPRQRVADVNR